MSINSSSNATRALEILLILGEVGAEGMSLSQIVTRLGVAKSGVHRSLMSLTEKGFAEPAEKYGYYRLGSAIPMLAKRQERIEPLVQQLRPGMTEFARLTGFTVYCMIQSGVDCVCAEIISRSTRRQFSLGIGGRVPMGIAAGSLALLSMLDRKTYEQIINDNAERYRLYPAVRYVDSEIIKKQVVDTIRRGYAVNAGYYLPGEGGLGLPIPKQNNYGLNVAVSFNVPIEMMTEQWMESIMQDLRQCFFRS